MNKDRTRFQQKQHSLEFNHVGRFVADADRQFLLECASRWPAIFVVAKFRCSSEFAQFETD